MATVVTSKFTPFTFEELLKPALMATQAHYEMEDAYTELATKANVWESLANSERDKDVYNMYKAYSDDLKKQADILASQGLNANSRKALSQMKARYSSEIDPIEKAAKKREALINEQRGASLNNDSLMFDKDASSLKLTDLINNPSITYTSRSGKMLAAQVGSAAKQLSKELRDNPRKWEEILGKQYYQTRTQKGYTADEVYKASIGDPSAPKELLKVVEDVIDSSGIKEWNNSDTLNRAYSYARQGLLEAIGDTVYDIKSNKAYDYAMQEAAKLREEARRGQQQIDYNLLAINPVNIYSSKKVNKAKENVNKFSKYFITEKDGNTIISPEGRKEIKKTKGVHPGFKYADKKHEGPVVRDTDFYDFLVKDLKLNPISLRADGWAGYEKAIAEAWNNYNKDNDVSTYDASKVTEYNSMLAPEDRKTAKNAILQAIKGIGKLYEVDFNSEANEFKYTGDAITDSDLNNDKYEVLSTNMSAFGSTVMIKDKDGEVKRYHMPSINPYMETFRNEQLKRILKIQSLLLTPGLSDEEKASLESDYKVSLNAARLYDSQIFLTNKTKPQEFNPYPF